MADSLQLSNLEEVEDLLTSIDDRLGNSLPLPSGAAIETGGNLATIAAKDFATEYTLLGVKTAVEAIGGGGDGAILDGVSSAIKATVHDYTNSNPLAVVLRDTNGDYVSVGGGTQYADGAVRGTATGTIAMGDDGTNIQSIHVDASGDLQVDVLTMPTVAVTGTFYQATQPVSIASMPSTPVTGTFYQATQPVSAASLPLPTGAATSAKQDTQITAEQAIQTAVEIIDNAISGSEMQVDIVSMPAVDTELTTADLDTGAGTDTRAVVGLVGSKSGGGELIPGSATDGLLVNLGANNDVVVSATDLDIRNLTNVDVVTAELSAVDNAVLDTIAAKDFATQTTLAALNAKLVTGTVIGDVNLGATDNAVLDAIEADTTTIAGAVAGTEMQVDVVAALPAGTNAIGKLLQPDIDVTTNTNYVKKYYTNAGAVTDGIVWSPVAGKRWHIHTLYLNVSAAATVTLEDDLAAGDSAVWKGELAANSGVVLTFPEKYPWASGEDAADLIITTSAGNVYVTVSGIEI